MGFNVHPSNHSGVPNETLMDNYQEIMVLVDQCRPHYFPTTNSPTFQLSPRLEDGLSKPMPLSTPSSSSCNKEPSLARSVASKYQMPARVTPSPSEASDSSDCESMQQSLPVQ